jgi:hypothetical protein
MALLSAYGLGALEVERVQRNLSEQAEPFDRLRASPSDRLKTGPFDGLRTGRFDELKTRSASNGWVGSTPGIAGNHWPIPIGIHPEYNSGSWRWRVPSNAQRRNF